MEPRDNVLGAKAAMIAQASIGLTLVSIALCLQFIGLREKYSKLQFSRRTDQTILIVMGVTICVLAFFLDQMSMYAHDWTGNPDGCRLTGRPFICGLFTVSKMFLYYFLFCRATIVLDSLKLEGPFLSALRALLIVAIWIGIPYV